MVQSFGYYASVAQTIKCARNVAVMPVRLFVLQSGFVEIRFSGPVIKYMGEFNFISLSPKMDHFIRSSCF